MLPAFILFFDFHFEKKSEFWGITQNWVMTGKLRHEATSSLNKEEPSSASKTFKIAHQQTFELLLSNCYYLTSP
jgi:hypothetical protein